MRSVLAWAAAIGTGVVLTLAAVWFLLPAAAWVHGVGNPWLQALAIAGVLLVGTLLLVGSVYVATHFTVRLFPSRKPPPRSDPQG